MDGARRPAEQQIPPGIFDHMMVRRDHLITRYHRGSWMPRWLAEEQNVNISLVLKAFLKKRLPFISKTVWFSIGFITKMKIHLPRPRRNLCYHGTGSEEGAIEGVHGQQDEEVAWCKHKKHEDNKDSKEPIATQCILRKLLLTRDGPPRGDPGLGNSNAFPLLPVLPWAPVGFRTFARVMLRKRWANSF